MEEAFLAEDEAEDAAEERAAAKEAAARAAAAAARQPKPLDQGGGLYFYEKVRRAVGCTARRAVARRASRTPPSRLHALCKEGGRRWPGAGCARSRRDSPGSATPLPRGLSPTAGAARSQGRVGTMDAPPRASSAAAAGGVAGRGGGGGQSGGARRGALCVSCH